MAQSSKHMYDILTSIYAALFRTSTPLYLDWRKPENFALLGNCNETRFAFTWLVTELYWFCMKLLSIARHMDEWLIYFIFRYWHGEDAG